MAIAQLEQSIAFSFYLAGFFYHLKIIKSGVIKEALVLLQMKNKTGSELFSMCIRHNYFSGFYHCSFFDGEYNQWNTARIQDR